MTDLRRKLIEHEIKKHEELREMFRNTSDEKVKSFLFNRIPRRWKLARDYYKMSLNMFEKSLDWRNLLQEQQ